jgi:TrmH family RNA methyltransferase
VLTKNNVKFIKSLQLKKYRQKERLFIVEGEKNTVELLKSTYEIKSLVISQAFLERYESLVKTTNSEIVIVEAKQLAGLGSYQTNEQALAVVHEPEEVHSIQSGFQLVLDDIRDPGNLGTIIRIADWYGIPQILCSETTAEFYNPKTISASMGSIFRIPLVRLPLESFLAESKHPVYGALLDGKNVHQIDFPQNGYLVIGNESTGIKDNLLPFIKHRVTIPRIGAAESLNAAMATAIICDNIFRKA